MRIRVALATAALVLFPLAVSAQQPAVAEGLAAVGPGKFAGVVEAKVTLVVELDRQGIAQPRPQEFPGRANEDGCRRRSQEL